VHVKCLVLFLNVTAEIASSFHPTICSDILEECSELYNRVERMMQMRKYQESHFRRQGNPRCCDLQLVTQFW
jgi:hypothetical protein